MSTSTHPVVLVLVGFVALQHVGFMALEMFLWRKPAGLKIFRMEQAFADSTAHLAANQGLYNGFLAAGLLWSLFAARELSFPLQVFFLGCVIVAGLFGAATVSWRILVLQALPAALALGAVLALGRE